MVSKDSFSDGITAICGLNGAGKSTVIAAVKDILGVILTESDRHKLKGSTVNGKVVSKKRKSDVQIARDIDFAILDMT